MQPVRVCPAVMLTFWVFVLTACSSQPGKPGNEPVHTVPSTTARQTVIATARDMLGRPYRYGGTTPRGFDCSGLVWYSHQRAGIAVPRTSQQQMNRVKPVSIEALKAGDLLFFSIDGSRSYHVGIYLGSGHFIHAPSRGKQVTTSRLENPYWRNRLLQVGNYY